MAVDFAAALGAGLTATFAGALAVTGFAALAAGFAAGLTVGLVAVFTPSLAFTCGVTLPAGLLVATFAAALVGLAAAETLAPTLVTVLAVDLGAGTALAFGDATLAGTALEATLAPAFTGVLLVLALPVVGAALVGVDFFFKVADGTAGLLRWGLRLAKQALLYPVCLTPRCRVRGGLVSRLATR